MSYEQYTDKEGDEKLACKAKRTLAIEQNNHLDCHCLQRPPAYCPRLWEMTAKP